MIVSYHQHPLLIYQNINIMHEYSTVCGDIHIWENNKKGFLIVITVDATEC